MASRSCSGARRRAALGFISPWILGFLVFTAGPMVASLVLSFTDYSLVGDTKGVGTANYQELLSDPRGGHLAGQHLHLRALYVPLGTAVGARAGPAAATGSVAPPGSSARRSTCP